MDLSHKKFLVTGADGFIGSHLVEQLLRRGFEVRALAQYNSFGTHGWLDNLPDSAKQSVEVVLGDIRDPFSVNEMMQGCDVVFHLAALIAIPYSYFSPGAYVETNIKGTLNLLQAAKKLNVKRFIQTSTSEVYGTALYAPINEDHPLQGQSPYSASKIGSDQMAIAHFTSFDMPISIIRPFNTYGPRQSLRAVIPSIIYQLLNEVDVLELGNVDTTRDFCFVEDTVRGFIEVAQCDACIGQVTNVGSGYEISIKDTVKLIQKVMGTDVPVVSRANRLRPKKSEVYRLIADISKARRLFNWQPHFTGSNGIECGLRKTVDWFVDSNNQARYPKSAGYVI